MAYVSIEHGLALACSIDVLGPILQGFGDSSAGTRHLTTGLESKSGDLPYPKAASFAMKRKSTQACGYVLEGTSSGNGVR